MSNNRAHHADFGRDFDAELGILPAPEQSTDPLDIATQAMRDAVAMLGEDTRTFDGFLAEQRPTTRTRFTPGYERDEDVRVLRVGVSPDEHGVDRIRFHGAVRSAWISVSPSSGRGSVYAEVDRSASIDTLMGVAVIPTGKPVPVGASRMGSAGSAHFYLLGTHAAQCGTHGRLALPAPDGTDSTTTDVTGEDGEG